MLKILITGGDGYVGSNLVDYFKNNNYDVYSTQIETNHQDKIHKVDIVSKLEVEKVVRKIKPDIIIHTAGLSSLKLCEDDPKKADEINYVGTKNLVDTIRGNKLSTKLIFFSSDYVFDGNRGNYLEIDSPKPKTVYGQSKLKAEKYIQNNLKNFIILRTANIYGRGGNFYSFVKNSLEKEETIDVFDDVFFTPTNIDFLISSINDLIMQDYAGVIHIAGRDKASRYEFARRIALAFGCDQSLLKKIKQPLGGMIAKDCSLNTKKLEKILNKTDVSLEKHLNYLSGNLIKPYFNFVDERGQIIGISQDRKWLEINYLESKKGCVRGGHYHQKTKEAFYFIKGKIKISFKNIKSGKTREFIAEGGDISEIPVYTMHNFEILEDTSWINMLSIPMKGEDKDFHK